MTLCGNILQKCYQLANDKLHRVQSYSNFWIIFDFPGFPRHLVYFVDVSRQGNIQKEGWDFLSCLKWLNKWVTTNEFSNI